MSETSKDQVGSRCGTAYGRQIHRKKGETVCEACRIATNAVNAKSRAKNREKELARHADYRQRMKAKKEREQKRAKAKLVNPETKTE